MGLFKAAGAAIGSTFGDQWKEVIKCDNLDNETLMVKVSTPNGVISKDSVIIVKPGQLAVIMDNGKVIDATAEDGQYKFDQSTSPSFFAGQFGAVFKEMWTRFTYDGGTYKEQVVFFINTKEIIDNKFGTPTPIPYGDWGHPVLNARTNGYIPMSLEIKCFGKYTFKIIDPALFMQELAGTADVYTKEMLTEQIRSEVVSVFMNVLNSLSDDTHKVEALKLPSQTDEIKAIMDEMSFDGVVQKRGIAIKSFAVESVTLDEKSKVKIDEYEFGGDAFAQKAKLVSSYGNAMENAAANSAGAMNGFMGLGFMNMTTGAMGTNLGDSLLQQTTNIPTPPQAQQSEQPITTERKCTKCGNIVKGKFCEECGTEYVETEKKCAKCGSIVKGKFCSECGTKIEE